MEAKGEVLLESNTIPTKELYLADTKVGNLRKPGTSVSKPSTLGRHTLY